MSPFLGKGRMHPFVDLSIGFWLYTALQYRSSMSSNSLIGLCFRSKFSKCFHSRNRSCWLVAFSWAFVVLFLLLTSFTVCHATLDCLSSTKSLILSIWFCMYSVCSFRYMLANSFCAFLSFRALVLVGFFLLHSEEVFTSAHFFLTANVSHETLGLGLSLVAMHSTAASKLTLTKFSYSSC